MGAEGRLRSPAATQPRERAIDALAIGGAFGLLAGLGEGVGLLALQAARRSRWPITFSCGSEVLWVAPLLDLALFSALAWSGFLLLAAVRIEARARFVAGGAAALLVYDWARLSAAIGRPAAAGLAVAGGLAVLAAGWRRGGQVIRIARRSLLPIATIALLVAGGDALRRRETASRRAAPAEAQDVLVVILDTVRADRLSCYGASRATTPRIDAIAAEGARFTACFSTSSWTLPAHASLLTGRYPWEHGAHLEPLDDRWPLLSEAFRDAGWRTGAVSANLCFFHTGFGFGRGFERFDDFGWSWSARFAGTLVGRELLSKLDADSSATFLRKPASAIVDRHLDWLDQAPGRAAFSVLNFFDAHDPYEPPAATAGRFEGDRVAPDPMPPAPDGASRPWSDATLADELRRYDECLLAIDQQVGRLVDELAKRGRLDRTWLCITSDHGESFGERGARLHRGSLHKEQVHVPLIVRAPDRALARTTVDTPVSLQSLAATLAELARLPGASFPGPSLAPLLTAAEEERGEAAAALADLPLLAELARHPWPEYRRRPCYDGAIRSLLRGRWHYLHHATRGAELYDWLEDPREERDLADSQPDLVATLESELRRLLADQLAHEASLDDSDQSARPELGGVGYVGGG
jgi:arylsulfatase A-like enzyme